MSPAEAGVHDVLPIKYTPMVGRNAAIVASSRGDMLAGLSKWDNLKDAT
jgi:hypothetical protein